jgi:hypothetical protein
LRDWTVPPPAMPPFSGSAAAMAAAAAAGATVVPPRESDVEGHRARDEMRKAVSSIVRFMVGLNNLTHNLKTPGFNP